MKAFVHDQYGGPDRLTLAERPDPVAGKGEVLVEVHAAAVDSGTLHMLAGKPYLVRPYSGLRRPRFPVPGRDLAGVVTAVGPEVTGVRVGDEIIGTAAGSLAERAVVPVKRLAAKPASLSFTDAAALPVSGITALKAVRDAARITAGQRVLVLGASGGVGSYAVQLAVTEGAEVVAVCSAAKGDFVLGLGASKVLDYATDDLAAGAPYDAILDIAGNRRLRDLRALLTPRGTLALVGGEDGGPVLGGMQRNLAALFLSPFLRQRLTGVVAGERGADMAVLGEYVEQGRLRPAVTQVFDFADAPQALTELAAGRVRGKVAVRVR